MATKYRVKISWGEDDRRDHHEEYVLPGEIRLDAIYRMAHLPGRYGVKITIEIAQ